MKEAFVSKLKTLQTGSTHKPIASGDPGVGQRKLR